MSPRRILPGRVDRETKHPADAGARDLTPLLLSPGLPPAEAERLLAPFGFENLRLADSNLQEMAGEPRARGFLAAILEELLDSVSSTADPDLALNRWEEFLREGPNRAQLFEYLGGVPRLLNFLSSIFGNSPALAQTLVRDPMLIYWLVDEQVLKRRPSRQALARGLESMLRNLDEPELKLAQLRRFRRREVLRIGGRDLLHLSGVPETTAALSDLAGVLIQAAFGIVQAEMYRQFGVPMHRDRRGRLVETGFAVIGMGKLGGGELNFSSDVDLIYVYAADEDSADELREPERDGHRASSIPNEEFFERLSRSLTQALEDVTQEGHVLRVDLRLRPEGNVGRLARPLVSFREYYRRRGQDWERLALLKAWPIAGDRAVGKSFLRIIEPFTFPRLDPNAAGALFKEVGEIKDLIDRKIAARGETERNVKLGMGGIREIEFLVQAVQVACGERLKDTRDRTTLGALVRLCHRGLLSAEETQTLREAYLFLRDVEHKLQMVNDLQTHALPQTRQELARCAIRLGYSLEDRGGLAERFSADHYHHTTEVHRLFDGFFRDRSSNLWQSVQLVLSS